MAGDVEFGQTFDDISKRLAEARAKKETDYFGQSVPVEYSASDFPTSEVHTKLMPGGGSIPFTSMVEGNVAQFPLAAYYKTRQGALAAKQKVISDFYKSVKEPEAFATYQPREDKFWNEQVMGHFDNVLLPKYGANAYRIAEGNVHNKQEAADYQDWQTRLQSANNLAQHSNLLGGAIEDLKKMQSAGKYVPQSVWDKMAFFGELGKNFHTIDSTEDMNKMNEAYNAIRVLPDYLDTVDKLSKNPQLTTAVKKYNGNVLEIEKNRQASVPQLDNWADTMFNTGYTSPNDPDPSNTSTPEGIAERKRYLRQDLLNSAKQEYETTFHNLPVTHTTVKVEQDKPTFFESSAKEADLNLSKVPDKADAVEYLSNLSPEHFLPARKDERDAITIPLNINIENLAKGEINQPYFLDKVIPRTMVYNTKGELVPFMSESELYKLQNTKVTDKETGKQVPAYKIEFSTATPSLVFGDKMSLGEDGQPHKLLRRKITGEQMKQGYKPFFDIQYTMTYQDKTGAIRQKTLHHYVDATQSEAPKQLDDFYFGLSNAKTLETAAEAALPQQ